MHAYNYLQLPTTTLSGFYSECRMRCSTESKWEFLYTKPNDWQIPRSQFQFTQGHTVSQRHTYLIVKGYTKAVCKLLCISIEFLQAPASAMHFKWTINKMPYIRQRQKEMDRNNGRERWEMEKP